MSQNHSGVLSWGFLHIVQGSRSTILGSVGGLPELWFFDGVQECGEAVGGAAAHVWNALMCAYALTSVLPPAPRRGPRGRAARAAARAHRERHRARARAEKNVFVVWSFTTTGPAAAGQKFKPLARSYFASSLPYSRIVFISSNRRVSNVPEGIDVNRFYPKTPLS